MTRRPVNVAHETARVARHTHARSWHTKPARIESHNPPSTWHTIACGYLWITPNRVPKRAESCAIAERENGALPLVPYRNYYFPSVDNYPLDTRELALIGATR